MQDAQMVKVGKANNLNRIPYFNEAGYANVTDWEHALTLLVESNEAALALESMINAKLTNQGYKLAKIMWNDLKVPNRRVGATECYNCHIDHAIEAGINMSNIYHSFVA